MSVTQLRDNRSYLTACFVGTLALKNVKSHCACHPMEKCFLLVEFEDDVFQKRTFISNLS